MKKQRNRRNKSEMAAIRDGLHEILSASNPQTVRGVFYQSVSTGLVSKTEAEYKGTICRLLKNMRLDGDIPFEWIADHTRWMRKPDTWYGLEDMLYESHRLYRRSVWNDQPEYVEIWCEKDSIAGLLYEETHKWDVPLMVSRGFSSLTFLFEAAFAIKANYKPAYIYYFGDWDPAGLQIGETIEQRLHQFAPETEIHFIRQAVTPEQIECWNLPTRPTKKTDSRSKTFDGDSVEVDAIPAENLKSLVRRSITKHIEDDVYQQTLMAEAAEKQTLSNIITNSYL